MKKIEKLTPEQEALLPAFVDYGLQYGLNTSPCDRPKAEAAIRAHYAALNRPEPKLIIWLDSPHQGAIGAAMLAGTKFSGAQVRAQVWAQVGDQVGDQVRAQVWAQVGTQVWAQVWAQVGAQVWDQVRAQVWDQVRAKHLHFFEFARYGNVFDFGWGSFYEFFQRIGQSLGKAERQFDAFKNLITSGIYDMIQFDGLCIVCEMPRAIHRDGARRLHSTGGPSIIWADGFELYHLWGVAFPKELHEKITSRAISAKDVLKIENMEQRMAALKSLGAESVIEALDSKLVATSERGNALYAIKGIGRQKNYCLKYKCPSTNREYVSFVPPDVGNANDPDAAMAWKFSLTKEQYQDMKVET